MSSRCGTICSTQIPTIPLSNKESPCKLIFTPGRHMLNLEETCAKLRSSSLRYNACLTWSRAPQLYMDFIVPFRVLGIEQVLSPFKQRVRTFLLIFFTPHPIRSCVQSKSLLFTALVDYMCLAWSTRALLFTTLNNTSYMKHLKYDYLPLKAQSL